MIFSYFILEIAQILLRSFESMGLSFLEKKCKTGCQDGCHGGYLGFPIKTILSIFYLQVAPILSTKFRATGFLVQKKKFK